MKKIYPALVAALMLSFTVITSAAVAQSTATPVPTHTPYPTFYPTSTPIVYDFPTDFSCPLSGTPIAGWGTVTPDAFWSAGCSQCMVAPMYTSTAPVATVTPYAYYCGGDDTVATPNSPDCLPVYGNTPTATVTVPIPSVTPSAGCGDGPQWYNTQYTKYSIISINDDSVCENVSRSTSFCHGHYSAGSSTGDYGEFSRNMNFTGIGQGAEVYWDVVITGVWWTGGFWLQTCPGCGMGTLTLNDESQLSVYNSAYHGTLHRQGHFPVGNGAPNLTVMFGEAVSAAVPFDVDYELRLSVGTSCLFDVPNVATETPTPSPLSYCEAVNGGAGSESSGDAALSWEGVRYGYNACVDLGGWHFSVLSLDVDVPLIGICMQDVSFANIILFGMSISLDAILYVLVAAWALKRMFTS